MSTRVNLLMPVGRLVQGSLYTGSTTDAEGRLLIYKTGANAGQPRTNFWFNVAIKKQDEQHWNQTDWGKKVWAAGHAGFPQGQANSPTFAWKIIDGDSQISKPPAKSPCELEGFPGHWVVRFSGSFAPSLFNENGTQALTEPNAIQLGDFIQVYGYVEDNRSTQQPGVYMNPSMVARSGFGQRIIVGVDAKDVGFGKSPLPAGASSVPMTTMQVPVPPPVPVAAPVPPPAPYPSILTPPMPPVTAARVMLPKANGATYESLIAIGWTDAALIEHGMMQA